MANASKVEVVGELTKNEFPKLIVPSVRLKENVSADPADRLTMYVTL
jgi:hypothetical protein